jgi:NitT/TauT family transport system substrate-binding protein
VITGLCVAVVLVAIVVAGGNAAPLTPVVFQLNTIPSPPDHAYFELGIEKGFYRAEGLDVSLAQGTGSSTTLRLVGAARAGLGFVDVGTMILGVLQGIPVKSIMVVNQGSPMAVIFKKDKGYRHLQDLRGASIATTQTGSLTQIFPLVLRANGMTTNDVKLIYTGNPTAKEVAMLNGNADAYLGFYTENAIRNQVAGHDVGWIRFADAGVNIMNLAVVANTPWLRENPAVARGFVRATQRAIQYTVQNPREAAAIFYRNHSRDFTEALILQMIQSSLPLLRTPNSRGLPYGVTAEEDWKTSERLISEYANFKPLAGVSVYYTNEFAVGR